MKVMVIGDIHSRIELVDKLPFDECKKVILLGDLLHGPNGLGVEVIDFFMSLEKEVNVNLVLGNHELFHVMYYLKPESFSPARVMQWDYCSVGLPEKANQIYSDIIKEVNLLGEIRMDWLCQGKAKLIINNREFYHARQGVGRVWEDKDNAWFKSAVAGTLNIGNKMVWVGHENVRLYSSQFRFTQECGGVVTCLDWGAKKGGPLGWEVIDI